MKLETYVCPKCQQSFTLHGRRRDNVNAARRQNPNYVGPFCSKQCSSSRNATLMGKARAKPPETFVCPQCSRSFAIRGKRLSLVKVELKTPGYVGPFCSRKCAGKGNMARQLAAGTARDGQGKFVRKDDAS